MQKTYHKLLNITFGHLAFAAFFIAVVSGVVIIAFFDVNHAADSIGLMMMANPAASFLRSLHYWSGQFFLLFSLLHVWDHLRLSTEKKVKSGTWLRLTLAIPVLLMVMLSGFLLKADSEGLQARQILNTLLHTIHVSFAFLGKPADLQVIYIHHVATFTIFLSWVIIEHVKRIWPQTRALLYSAIAVILFSFFLPAALHTPLDPVIKGPWYFVGLQEILRFITSPGLVLTLLALLLLGVYLLPRLKEARVKDAKRVLLALTFVYLFLSVAGFFFRGENGRFTMPWENPGLQEEILQKLKGAEGYFGVPDTLKRIPQALGRREGCLSCHGSTQGLSVSHASIGCASCHLGNALTLQKNLAHTGMIAIPGNLAHARQTCGTASCHPGISERVQRSLMHTMNGVVSVDRFTFDEQALPDGHIPVEDAGNGAADTHLKNLCASCHLGKEKEQPGPIDQLSRGGGCNACHLQYNPAARQSLKKFKQDKKAGLHIHSRLTIQADDTHCFGCHSRSGRIATSYEGWHETQMDESEMPAGSGHRLLQDGRVFRFVSDDVHHQKGLACIDCHTSAALMGDGTLHQHEAEQEKIACADCHNTTYKNTKMLDELDGESLKIARLRGMALKGRRYLATQKEGVPIINSFMAKDGRPRLTGKLSGKTYPLRAPAEICTRGTAHDALSCASCHTAWAPQCLGCHTVYDPQKKGIDHLTGKKTDGRWDELIGEFMADQPTLGVRSDSAGQHISTFIPGMILTIDASRFTDGPEKEIFKRLFAPLSAHTVSARGRSCTSCHNDPLALGFGRGQLNYEIKGKYGRWHFIPAYAADKHDGLPQDAWTGFLKEGKKPYATRIDARPFNVAEQKKILRVGACLTCHKGDSKVMLRAMDNFDALLKQVSLKCRLPVWQE